MHRFSLSLSLSFRTLSDALACICNHPLPGPDTHTFRYMAVSIAPHLCVCSRISRRMTSASPRRRGRHPQEKRKTTATLLMPRRRKLRMCVQPPRRQFDSCLAFGDSFEPPQTMVIPSTEQFAPDPPRPQCSQKSFREITTFSMRI